MEEKEKEIITRAGEIYMKYGLKSVTMDDMARQLSISKKTLYKYVSDKADLVKKVMSSFKEQDQQEVTLICQNAQNSIDEVFGISKKVVEILADTHPSIFYDLEKYYPEAWEIMCNHHDHFVMDCVKKNLDKGKEEGLYRSDLNTDIIAKVYTSRMDEIFSEDLFPASQYNRAELYLELFRYHIRGIASPKGIEYLKEKVQKEQSNQS